MSIKHVLLALDQRRCCARLRTKETLRRDDGHDSASLQQAQIYNNMRLLEEAGQIELEARIEQENLPDRKSYRLTDAGRSGVTKKLDVRRLPAVANSADDFYLKLTTLAKVLKDQAQLSALLWQQREVYLQHLRDLERALTEAEKHNDAVTASLLDGAILHAEADLAWLERIEERLLRGV